MFWVQALGLLLIPPAAGWLLDTTNTGITNEMLDTGVANLDYTYTTLMFAFLAAFGLVFAFFLKREDSRNLSRVLENPEKTESDKSTQKDQA
jgi:hypothetical protein